jgi:hypothetical protein
MWDVLALCSASLQALPHLPNALPTFTPTAMPWLFVEPWPPEYRACGRLPPLPHGSCIRVHTHKMVLHEHTTLCNVVELSNLLLLCVSVTAKTTRYMFFTQRCEVLP